MAAVPAGLAHALQDRYRLDRELGQGGMATVYLAQDLRHHRPVALKVLRPDLAATLGTERFLREIQVEAGLTHPHILPLHDSGEADGLLYYVMPFIEGESLRDRLVREHSLPVAEAVRLGREVADALAYAHAHGVVHRDIKPENILLSSGHAVVADFGIARAIDVAGGGQITETGTAVGSPIYMSPEQAEGDPELDGRSDVYSLGCVLYEAVTGQPPFSGRTALAIIVSRLLGTPPPIRAVQPSVPVGLESVIAKAMATDPTRRFATAAECALALTALEAGTDPGLRIEHKTEPASIAVLPFINLSPDPDNEYFSIGMSDELTNALAKIPGLRVAARSSAFSFKGKEQDVRQIGARLGVHTVLEGSVRKAGNRLRIAAQLVDTETGYHLWSETYDRDLKDVFDVQEDISRTIAQSLKVKLVDDLELVEPGTRSLEAYTLCMRGQYHADKRTTEGFKLAIGYFEQAIALDPEYALAYSELGASLAFRGFDEFADLSPKEAMPKAKAAIEKALELDPSLAQAHARLGMIAFLYDWAWPHAEQELVRAITLKPQYAFAYVWHSMLMSALDRHEESIRSITRAQTLDPLSLPVNMMIPRTYYWARRYEEALRQAQAMLEMEPRYQLVYLWLGRIYLAQGRFAEALAFLEKGRGLTGASPNLLGILGMVYGKLGRQSEALAILQQFRDAGGQRWVSPFFASHVLIGLGDTDGALRLLEDAYQQRSGFIVVLQVDPLYDEIRSETRFQHLLQKVGLGNH